MKVIFFTGKWWGSQDVQPTIAIHGWQDNASTFDPLAEILVEKGLSVYCIDLPGHGFSSHIPQGHKYYIYWDGVHFLRRIVRHFGWKNISIIGHSLGGGIAFLYAALFPDDVRKYVSIDISSPCTKNTKKTIDFISGAVDKFLDYEKKSLEDLPSYEYKDMLKIMEDAYKGSVNTKGCEILLRRGMRKATNKEGYQFTRDPRLKLGLLGFVTMDQALEFASRIKCEVMNIKAKDGLIKKLDDPENYDIVFDYIGKNAKTLEMLAVEGTHHVHLNDADSIAPSIHKFLVS